MCDTELLKIQVDVFFFTKLVREALLSDTERNNLLAIKIKVIIMLTHFAAWKASEKMQLCTSNSFESSLRQPQVPRNYTKSAQNYLCT